MKRPEPQTQTEMPVQPQLQAQSQIIPVHDYRQQLQKAVNWLGDRYLLAEPTPRRKDEFKGYFAEARHWHGAAGAGVQRRTH